MKRVLAIIAFLVCALTYADTTNVLIRRAAAGTPDCSPPSDIALIWNGAGCLSPPCYTGTYEFDDVDEYPVAHSGDFQNPSAGAVEVVSGGPIGTGNSMYLDDIRASGNYFELSADLYADGIIASDDYVCIFAVHHSDHASLNPGRPIELREGTGDVRMEFYGNFRSYFMDVYRLFDSPIRQTNFTLAWLTDAALATSPEAWYRMTHWVNGVNPSAYTLSDSRVHAMTTAAGLYLGAYAAAFNTGTAPTYVDSVFVAVGTDADEVNCRCGDTSACTAAGWATTETFQNLVVTEGQDLCSEW